MRRGTLWLSSFLLLSFPGLAWAESAPAPCWVGTPWPASGTVPFDQPAFVVPGYSNFAGDSRFELVATTDEGDVTIVGTSVSRRDDTFVIEPTEALPVGVSLELRGDVCESFTSLGEVSVLYRVLDMAAAPPAPPLRLTSRVTGYADRGYYWGFRGEVAMHVDGGGVLAQWVPWVVPSVQIGSEPTFTQVVDRRAEADVALACEGFDGLAPGLHDALGRLRTLDGAELGTVEARVSFDCEAARFVELGTGRELSPAEVAALRRAPPDAGVDVARDAGRSLDGGSHALDAGARDAGLDDSIGEGGCRASGRGVAGGAGGIVVLLLCRWKLAALRA